MKYALVLAVVVCGGMAHAATIREDFGGSSVPSEGPPYGIFRSDNGILYPKDSWQERPGMTVQIAYGQKSWDLRLPRGGRFSVRDVDVYWTSPVVMTGPGPAPEWEYGPDADNAAYADWLSGGGYYPGRSFGFYGLRGGVVVAALEFGDLGIRSDYFAPGPLGYLRLSFGPMFSNLDAFRVAQIGPEPTWLYSSDFPWTYDDELLATPNTPICVNDMDCGPIGISGMTLEVERLSDVPLPASLPAMVGAMALLGSVGLRRRRNARERF